MSGVKYYTGVGSRETPSEIMDYMSSISWHLSDLGYVLRSGGADGADSAFQCNADPDNTEIWIPWSKFAPPIAGNYITITDAQYSFAREFLLNNDILPWFDRMKQGAKKLHARNVFQIIGTSCKPSEFCLYYAEEDNNGKVSGGTRTAVEVARLVGVPCYNFYFPE